MVVTWHLLPNKCKEFPMRINFVNCRIIKYKVDELRLLVNMTESQVVIGTESGLDGNVHGQEIFPGNYSCYRKDRNSCGGGVFIIVHESIVSNEMQIQPEDVENV